MQHPDKTLATCDMNTLTAKQLKYLEHIVAIYI
jgi:hypothetical protein